MSLASRLWDAHRDLAQRSLDHPFVQGLAAGDLPRERFAFYVGQDAYFLEAFARAYALALAKCPDREGVHDFKALLDGALEELDLHQGYAARWGIDLVPDPAPATLAYTDFLLATAGLEPVGQIAAAMTPCMRLYAWLGRSLEPVTAPGSPYREWVETYAGPEFDALASRLGALLDRYGSDDARHDALYRRALELEHAFFDAAWHS